MGKALSLLSLSLMTSLSLSSPALAKSACDIPFSGGLQERAYSDLPVTLQREKLMQELKTQNVAAFVKNGKTGPVPVILMNHGVNQKLQSFMDSSVGPQTLLQPGSPYPDHGMMRLGGFVVNKGQPSQYAMNLQVDWAMPETRNSYWGDTGEIHSTGILWRSLDWRLEDSANRNSYSRVTIEVAVVMKPKDRDTVEYYHRVRRAGLVGVLHENPHKLMKPEVPVAFHFYEGCFGFCTGTSLRDLKGSLEMFLREKGVSDPVSMLKEERTARFLSEARRDILASNAFDPSAFGPYMLRANGAVFSRLKTALRDKMKKVSDEDLVAIGNALVSLRSVVEMNDVQKRYGLTEDITGRGNIDNPHVAAILIYDSPEQAERFANATYTTRGVFEGTGWSADLQGTVPYADQRPLP